MWSSGMIAGAFLTILTLALGLIAGAYMVLNLFGMFLNRELSLGEFLVWTLAFLGLLITTIASLGTPLFYLLILLTIGLGLAPSFFSWFVDRLGNQRLRLQDLERYLRGTRERPDLPYNYRKLGDLYYEGRAWNQAVEWYEQAQKVHADKHVEFMLGKARERQSLGPGEPVLCVCGKLSPRGARQCRHCGATFSGSHEILAALGAGRGRLFLLLSAAALLSSGMAFSLLHVGVGFLNALLLLGGVVAAILHFYTTQAVGLEIRDAAGKTSDFRPQATDQKPTQPPPPSKTGDH